MQAAKGNSTTVYVPLIDDGVDVARPTSALAMGGDLFRLTPFTASDPEEERWQFPPGTIVRCRRETWCGGEILVAREVVSPDDIASDLSGNAT